MVSEISNTYGRTDRQIPIGKLISEMERTDGERIGTTFGLFVNFMKAMEIKWDTRWPTWLRHCATRRKVAVSIPDCAIGICNWHNPSSHPGVETACNRNGHQEYFLGLKTAGAYHLHVPIVLKSGSLNLPEPSGPVLACIMIALPLPWE